MKNRINIAVLFVLAGFVAVSIYLLEDCPILLPHEADYGVMSHLFCSYIRQNQFFLACLEFLLGPSSMTRVYCGHTFVFFIAPVVYFFGLTLASLRLVSVAVSFCSLVCFFYVLRCWLNSGIAFVALLLLAFDPVFMRYSIVGADRNEILQICLFWSGLAFIELFRKTRFRVFLFCSGFVFGLALWAKLLFLGYLFGVIVALLCLGRNNLSVLKLKLKIGFRGVAVFLSAFILGSLPFWHLNCFSTSFCPTASYFFYRLFSFSPGEQQNLSFFSNFLGRCHHFYELAVIEGGMSGWALLVPGVVVVAYLFSRSTPFIDKVVLRSLLIVFFVCFCLSSFVPTNAYIQQMLIVWPVVQIINASFVFLVFKWLEHRRFLRWAVLCLVMVLLLAPSRSLFYRTGEGIMPLSQARVVYKIADKLKQLSPGRLVSNNYNVSFAVFMLLPESRRNYVYARGGVPDRQDVADSVYVLYVPGGINGIALVDDEETSNWKKIKGYVREQKREMVQIAEIYDDQCPVPFVLYLLDKNSSQARTPWSLPPLNMEDIEPFKRIDRAHF